jgi:hypothetical protein
MDTLQNRMYNHEETPPEGVWESIAAELDSTATKIIPIKKKNNYRAYYLVAASLALIIFSWIFFSRQDSKTKTETEFVTAPGNDTSATENRVFLTVPIEQKTTAKNNEDQPVHRSTKDGQQEKNKQHKEDSEIVAVNTTRYITIEGPEGQPVKISSKMATLIDSAETKTPTKPIWNKKINEWREIMKGNTLAPTPGNFLDIVELTKTLKEKDNRQP